MIKYDVFDDYGNAGSQIQVSEHWDDTVCCANYPLIAMFIQLCVTRWNDTLPVVCTNWAKVGNKFCLLDVYRAKLEYPKLKEQDLSLAARWTPHAILIEAKTSGQQLVQELKTRSDLRVIEIVPHDDKLARFHQIVPTIKSGKVFLPHQAI